MNKPWDKPRLTILTPSASDARNGDIWGVMESNRHATQAVQTSTEFGGMVNNPISYTFHTGLMFHGAGPPPS